jgi:hypothetical protein
MNWLLHLNTINRHKWLVLKYCFRAGLYKQGLLHDLSKYSWVEFSVGAKYYQGNRSPNNAEREAKGYSLAWLHHKGRNKHHLEYWMDYSLKDNVTFEGMKMPVKHVVEMFCDRIAANRIYKKDNYQDGDPLAYFEASKERYLIHKETKDLLVLLLTMLKEQGEEKTFRYIRMYVLKGKTNY